MLLTNDTDADGDPLSVLSITGSPGLAIPVDLSDDGLSFSFKTGTAGGSVECPEIVTLNYTITDGSFESSNTIKLKVVTTNSSNNTIDLAGVDADGSYIDGKALNDKLTGSAAGDNLLGGSGNDVIRGLDGNDTLTGNAGNDSFVFNTTPQGLTNVDTITDFNAGGNGVFGIDKMALDLAIFTQIDETGTAGDDVSEFRASAGGNAVDADDYVLFDTSTGSLFYDADGIGSAFEKVQFAKLTGLSGTLDNTDFATIAPGP